MAEKKEVKKVKEPAKKEPAKKPTKKASEKVTEKKATAKKETVKKETVKKTPVKKAAAKKTDAKKTMQEYMDVIVWKKWEAHHMNWLYIEINAEDLMTEVEAGVSNLEACCSAMLDSMLEGDAFVTKPAGKTNIASTLTVRYYVDNLSPERSKY